MGINLANDDQLRALAEQVNAAARTDWRAAPLVPGANVSGSGLAVTNPADRRESSASGTPPTAPRSNSR
jgi:RHH-type proline utilization regulon transcriptional repressor/proline dehydrogenase/delta 1-pyrroline-5-carboxylate dehydrogenase